MSDTITSTSTCTKTGEPPILEAGPMRREPDSLRNAPRCHARTRSGKSCRSAAVKGKRVCRMHGGARGSGGPMGEANGSYEHGGWTHESVALRLEASRLLKAIRGVEHV